MKSFSLLIALVSLVSATPLLYDDQIPLNAEATTYPGFDLDLNALRLVQMDGQAPVWMTELEKIRVKAQGIKFFDITEAQDLGFAASARLQSKPAFPTPNATEIVRPILKTLSTTGMQTNLEKFSSFRTRYYRSDTGKQSQQWLLSTIKEITAKYASQSLREIITAKEFPHSWGQSSIILRIQGSSKSDDGVVVIGAHQDSTNMWPFLPAPGADDDGSGSVTILESYRALIAADFRPVRTVEFHWYSAEVDRYLEGGLLGSQAVAKDYEARSVNVLAMSQFDMTAWVKRGTNEEVGIITDFTDADLTAFNKALVDLYLGIPYVERSVEDSIALTVAKYTLTTKLEFSASWGKAGYPSSFTIDFTLIDHRSREHLRELQQKHPFDQRPHHISDEFSFTHMLEFSKLAVAFAVELGNASK
ncbi:peptidase [Pholiota molesta]|nr:peptidase [Pholiota molesta]